MSDDVVAQIWARRLRWSWAADRLKATLTYARSAALGLTATGALLETVSSTVVPPDSVWRTAIAAVGALCLAAATYVAQRLVTPDATRSWTRARSVSEAIKAEVYTYRAGARPYEGPDAPAVLLHRVHEVEEKAADLERYAAAADTRGASPAPPPLSPEDYVRLRLQQQIEGYYRRKAQSYAKKVSALRWLELALGLIATALGVAAAAVTGKQTDAATGWAAWVAVFTTLGSALAAHMAAARYDFLVMSYYATARRLEDLALAWRADGAKTDPVSWSKFVADCEAAISVENEGWLAKWAEKDK